jgi:hypothetical protein
MRRGVPKGAAQSRSDAAFDEMLGAVMHWLRQDDSLDLVALKVKAHLTQTYPSLMIVPSLLPSRDEFNSIACFGLTLRSRHALSAHDRRYLKGTAQLISMLDNAQREMREEEGVEPERGLGLEMIRTAADWQCLPKARIVIHTAAEPSKKASSVKLRSADEPGLRAVIEAAMFQPAAVGA